MDFSNYATKTDNKSISHVDTSSFAFEKFDKFDIEKLKNVPTNLRNLKTKVDNLDFHKLAPVPVDLRKLSNIAKNNVAKKDKNY